MVGRRRLVGRARRRRRRARARRSSPGPPRSPTSRPRTRSGACLASARCSWNHAVANSWQANRRQNAIQAHWYVEPLPRPPGRAADQLHRRVGQLRGRRPRARRRPTTARTRPRGLPNANHVDNANFGTPPDGQSPRMQMYLFMHDATPTANGAPALAVPRRQRRRRRVDRLPRVHARAVQPRLITDADGAGALNAPQAAAMGEGWSDWYAKDLVVAEGLRGRHRGARRDRHGRATSTPSRTRSAPRASTARSAAARRPARAPVAPRGGTAGRRRLHVRRLRQGPRQRRARSTATARSGARRCGTCAARSARPRRGRSSPRACACRRPSRRSSTRATRSCRPTRRCSAACTTASIWSVFAARGMGFFAGTEDATDVAPVESFADAARRPDAPTGTITGRVTDTETGAPARGHRGRRRRPGHARRRRSRRRPPPTAATRSARCPPAPTRCITFRGGAGYDRVSERAVTVDAGATRTLDVDAAAQLVGARGRRDGQRHQRRHLGPVRLRRDRGDRRLAADRVVGLRAHDGGRLRDPQPAPRHAADDDDRAARRGRRHRLRRSTRRQHVRRRRARRPRQTSASRSRPTARTFTTALEHTFALADRGRMNVVAADRRHADVALRAHHAAVQPAGRGRRSASGTNFVDLSEFAVYGRDAASPSEPPPAEEPPPGETPPARDDTGRDAAARDDPAGRDARPARRGPPGETPRARRRRAERAERPPGRSARRDAARRPSEPTPADPPPGGHRRRAEPAPPAGAAREPSPRPSPG